MDRTGLLLLSCDAIICARYEMIQLARYQCTVFLSYHTTNEDRIRMAFQKCKKKLHRVEEYFSINVLCVELLLASSKLILQNGIGIVCIALNLGGLPKLEMVIVMYF